MLLFDRKGFSKFIFLLVAALVIGAHSKAQEVLIRDIQSNKGIADVVVHNKKETKLSKSDLNGKADLSIFSNDAILVFQHPSYQLLEIPLASLEANNYVVDLTEQIYKMDELVISATKWKQEANEIPNKILSITTKEVAYKSPQTSADLLAQSGEVFVQKSQMGGGSPMMRGFSANKVLLSVEGVRMNNAIFRGGNLQNIINIDPNNVASAEVIFGPGSVLYGSDALGGVMNFNLKTPDTGHEKTIFKSEAFARYSSANKEKTGHLNFNLEGKKWGVYVGGTFSNFDDLRTGDKRDPEHPDFGKRTHYVERINGKDSMVVNEDYNIQKFSGFDQYNFMAKIRYRPSEKLDLHYTSIYNNTSDIPRYDRLIEYDENGQLKKAEWYYGPQEWNLHKLEMTFSNKNKLFDNFRTTAAYQLFKESRHNRNFGNANLRNQIERVDAYSLNFDLEKSFDPNTFLYYGAEGILNNVSSSAYEQNIETGVTGPYDSRYPDGGSQYSSLAAYAILKKHLNDKFILNAGMRYSWVALEAKIEDTSNLDFPYDKFELSNGSLNGSLGLVYQIPSGGELYLNTATGFRSPNLDDVGKVFDTAGDNVVVPNPDLKPEYTYNVEMGSKLDINESFKLNLSVFYTAYKDAIVDGNFTFNGKDSILYDGKWQNVMAKVNTGEAYIYGGSILAEIKLHDNLLFNTSLTYTEGKDVSNNEPLRHTTPIFGKTALIFNRNDLRIELNSLYNGNRPLENMPASEANKTHLYSTDGSLGWFTINAYSRYNFPKNIEATIAVENILDQHYRPYSSGISAAGRNFILSLKLAI